MIDNFNYIEKALLGPKAGETWKVQILYKTCRPLTLLINSLEGDQVVFQYAHDTIHMSRYSVTFLEKVI